MSGRETLKPMVVEALRALGGEGTILEVSRHVWEHHRSELEALGDGFFRWQYDIRWAATVLRHEGVLAPADRKAWKLLEPHG